MTDRKKVVISRLRNVIRNAAKEGVNIVCAYQNEENILEISGQKRSVKAACEDSGKKETLGNFVMYSDDESNQEHDYFELKAEVRLPKLPRNWKLSDVRKKLREVLRILGYGKSGRKQTLGVGLPPKGWPNCILNWSQYKGTTSSKLSVEDISIYSAHGYNVETYVEDNIAPETENGLQVVEAPVVTAANSESTIPVEFEIVISNEPTESSSPLVVHRIAPPSTTSVSVPIDNEQNIIGENMFYNFNHNPTLIDHQLAELEFLLKD